MHRSIHPLFRTLLSLLLYAAVYYALFKDVRSIGFLLAVIVIHEAGHYIAMKAFGYTNLQMMFIPLLGGFVRGEPSRVDPVRKMIVLMAGPMPGILIGMLAAMLYNHGGQLMFRDLSLMFVFLNVFNLLPFTPMDGGQMLETLFPSWARVIQTLFGMAVTVVLGFWQVISPTAFPLLLILLLWWRMFRIWREPPYMENEEGGRSIPTALQQLLFVMLWLVFMVVPMISVVRIWASRY